MSMWQLERMLQVPDVTPAANVASVRFGLSVRGRRYICYVIDEI